MKIREIKTKKSNPVNEIKLSSFVGDYGAALAKQTFGKNSGLTKQDMMASNIFTKNFVSSALSSLDNAVKGGIVSMPTPAVQQDRLQVPPGVNPAPAPTTKPAKIQPNAQPAKPATVQPRQTVAQKAQAQLQKQQTMKQKGKVPFRKPVSEEEEIYNKLNFIFESIMNEQDTYTIKDYLKNVWFPQFMRGVSYKENQDKIDQLLQQVENTYAKDRGRAALTQLAQLSFAISPRKSKQDKDSPATASITATWGNVKYTKGPKGWLDPAGKLADPNTAKILDQAVSSSQQNPAAPVNKTV